MSFHRMESFLFKAECVEASKPKRYRTVPASQKHSAFCDFALERNFHDYAVSRKILILLYHQVDLNNNLWIRRLGLVMVCLHLLHTAWIYKRECV